MIELKDIVVAYGERKVYGHLNLTVKDGETLAILGGSGAGKSTLLRLLIGLQRANSGQIIIDGTDIMKLTEDEFDKMRVHMGMVFQYSALFDSMNVFENVAFALRMHTKMKEDEIKAVVADKLRLVGLPGIEEYMPSELSGGMKKRVGLARAIAFNPSIVLYDEPTSGLDPVTSGTIGRLIKSMQRHLGCTSLVVTHDMNLAFDVADRIGLVGDKHFIALAPTDEFKNSTNPVVQNFIHGIDPDALIDDGKGMRA